MIAGIISEYNPFHNGHKYHIEQTRRITGCGGVVAVMSGNFVQRGGFAVYDKFTRARAAVACGIDLCLELPVVWASAPAKEFAFGAVDLLNRTGVVDILSFGSEEGKIGKLSSAAEAVAAKSDSDSVKENLAKGMSYPSALCAALDSHTANIISSPNNILAIEYINAIKRTGSGIKPFTIKRHAAGHDQSAVAEGFASASYIRRAVLENAKEYIPPEAFGILTRAQTADIACAEKTLLHLLRSTPIAAPEISEGLENKIAAAVRKATAFDEAVALTKSKRYTAAHIRRILINCILGITERPDSVPYARVLAFNNNGREILKTIKGNIDVITKPAAYKKLNPEAISVFETEIRAAEIYALAFPEIKSYGWELVKGICPQSLTLCDDDSSKTGMTQNNR